MLTALVTAILALSSGAVSSNTNSYTEATGNGSVTAFTFTMPTQDRAWIKVRLAGVLQATGYTLVLNANQDTAPGGTVTFSVAPTAGQLVRIERTVPYGQATVLTPYSAFPAKTVERAMDRLAMQVQQLNDREVGVMSSASVVRSTGATADRSLADRFADTVNVKDFGAVGDNSTDDTAAVQAAIASAIARSPALITGAAGGRVELRLSGTHRVTTLSVVGANGLIITGGTLRGEATGSYGAVLDIRDSANVVVRDVNVDAAFNGSYGAAIWVRATTGFMWLTDFSNVSISRAKVAWRFGDATYPDAHVSEITVHGGSTYSTPLAAEVIGTQTIVTFKGTQLISSMASVPAGWSSADQSCVKVVGAYVQVIGGECLHAETAIGSAIDLRPITSAAYSNPWGTLVASGAIIETAAPLVVAQNPGSVSTPGVGAVQGGIASFSQCGGYHGTTIPAGFIQTSADYRGDVRIADGNFYGVTQNTIVNAGSAATKVHLDWRSFRPGFPPPPGGIVGGTVVSVSGLPGQALMTYGASITMDNSQGDLLVINATNSTAFTISNPLTAYAGQRLSVRISNTSGGALGVATWGSGYRLAAWTAPATGYSRTITFQYDGAHWCEMARTAADVPN